MINLSADDEEKLLLANDFRLLVALDALLQTESVTKAAKRLQLSPSAMSRTLHRIRRKLGDPILARVGRGMVVTPRGVELRERVRLLVQEAQVLLTMGAESGAASAWRSFVLIVDDGYAGVLAPRLAAHARMAQEAVFHFLSEGHVDNKSLCDGTADLKIGRVYSSSSEIRVEHLSYSRYVGIAPTGHELLEGPVDVRQFASAVHIDILEADAAANIDTALGEYDLRRTISMTTRHYTSAFSMIAQTGLVAIVPEILVGQVHPATGLRPFELPVQLAPVAIRMAWHPRSDADPAHGRLRSCIREALQGGSGGIGSARIPQQPDDQG